MNHDPAAHRQSAQHRETGLQCATAARAGDEDAEAVRQLVYIELASLLLDESEKNHFFACVERAVE